LYTLLNIEELNPATAIKVIILILEVLQYQLIILIVYILYYFAEVYSTFTSITGAQD